LTKKEFESLADFRLALRKFLRFAESSAEVSGISSQTYQALLAVRGFPSRDQVTIGELAEALMIKHNSAVGLADRLQAQGLVTRGVSPVDRRCVFLSLTLLGERLVEDVATRNRRKLIELKDDFEKLLENIAEMENHPET